MSQGSRYLLVSLLAGLWAETGNAAAFDDELAALCREARGLGPVRAYTEQERRWIDGRRIYDARRSLGLMQAEAADRNRRVLCEYVELGAREILLGDADIIIAALQDPARK